MKFPHSNKTSRILLREIRASIRDLKIGAQSDMLDLSEHCAIVAKNLQLAIKAAKSQ